VNTFRPGHKVSELGSNHLGILDTYSFTLYIDTDKLAKTTKYRWHTEPKKIIIGNEIDESGHEFKGSIDDFRIYDRALKQEEIIVLYREKSWWGY
jgi:hypothetical protein